MNKILLLSILSFVSFIGARHYDEDHMVEKMAYTIAHLPKETIKQPAELSRQWYRLKADKLDLAVKEGEKVSSVFEGKDKENWQNYLNLSKQLAQTMRNLPAREYKKTYELFPQWMALKARRMEILSQQMEEASEQVKNDELEDILEDKAEMLSEKARRINQAIELSKSSTLKQDFNEEDDYEKPRKHGDGYRIRRAERHANRDNEERHGRLAVRDSLYQSREKLK